MGLQRSEGVARWVYKDLKAGLEKGWQCGFTKDIKLQV